MDPTANLSEQREIVKRMLAAEHFDTDAMRLAELCKALDDWLTGGGFKPAPWDYGRARLARDAAADLELRRRAR